MVLATKTGAATTWVSKTWAMTAWATATLALYGVGGAALATSLVKLRRRFDLSQAKHASLTGHARLARRLAAWVPFYDYDETRFFCSDDAPADIAAHRRGGFDRLSALYKTRFAETIRRTAVATDSISDLQFTNAYRVPFQYSRHVRSHLPSAAFMQSSDGVNVTDFDGNRFYDLSCSYGVNVFGYDFYKQAIERGVAQVRALGPVLGVYHPVVAENVKLLKEISGLDEVSFHMSGTEAMMQAARLARYHTRRSHLVRFCGAYHGWWDDVQPGIGNPLPAHETWSAITRSEFCTRTPGIRRDQDFHRALFRPRPLGCRVVESRATTIAISYLNRVTVPADGPSKSLRHVTLLLQLNEKLQPRTA